MSEEPVTILPGYLLPVVQFDFSAGMPSATFYAEVEAAARREFVGRPVRLTTWQEGAGMVTQLYTVTGTHTTMSGVSLRVELATQE